MVAGVGMVSAADVPQAALQPRTGYAYALDSGDLVYRELHRPRVTDGKLRGDRVRYVDPDGKQFARKEIHYAPDLLVPTFRLVDARTGYVGTLVHRSGGRIQLWHRADANANLEQATMKAPDGVVADAGFDLLIARKFDALKAGETVRVPFAAPSQLDTVAFRLHRIDRRKVLGQKALVVRMEADSAVIRWFTDPIDVAYAADTGALLRYEGLSNIPDPDADGNYRVRIDFPPEGVEPEPPE